MWGTPFFVLSLPERSETLKVRSSKLFTGDALGVLLLQELHVN